MAIPRFASAIAHITDLERDDPVAFRHALALAVAIGRETELVLLHGTDGKEDGFEHFPAIRQQLEAWGRLPANSAKTDVYDLCQVAASKSLFDYKDPLQSLKRFLIDNPADLLVMESEGRTGIPRWLHPSFSERLARDTRTMALFIHRGTSGFIDGDTGEIRIRRILLPVDSNPAAAAAVRKVIALAHLDQPPVVEVTLLHVGERMPDVHRPNDFCAAWYEEVRQGDVVTSILSVAKELSADLIVMPTQGHQGILDALRGSITEQVLRRAQCPVLAIPEP